MKSMFTDFAFENINRSHSNDTQAGRAHSKEEEFSSSLFK